MTGAQSLNRGGGSQRPDPGRPVANPTPPPAGEIGEPFPPVHPGSEVLRSYEFVRLTDTPSFGRYLVQQKQAFGSQGLSFIVTLYGATCSKVELRSGGSIGWPQYLGAMKHAIDREVGYRRGRGEATAPNGGQSVDVTVRDTDFCVTA